MKRASITEAKNNLSALIDRVKAGTPVLIVDRGRPVARLEPVNGLTAVAGEDRLAQLIRDGVIRPARSGPARRVWTSQPPKLRKGASAVRVLLAERRDGR